MSRPHLSARLGLVYGGVTFAGGLMLLVMVELPVLTIGNTKPVGGQSEATSNAPTTLPYSAIALVLLAVVSVVLGRVLAGRALRPLRKITASARSMTAEDLPSPVRVPAAYQEFADLADSLNTMSRRLHDSFTSQRQFIANASHELRTPLTVQRTLLELTLADPAADAKTLRATCQQLQDLGRQQEDLISALLTLAAGNLPVDHRESFDLAALTHKAVLDHTQAAASRGLHLATALTPATVTGDPHLVGSLITNLVANAVRHNVTGGTVSIATTTPGLLTVSNSGDPIAPSEIDRLFQPFQRSGTARTDQTEGHGLGLAIVAAIARAHQAPLTARPRRGGGLEITVDLAPG
ncbi:HAMP domain-containing sensor histidine kinase [Paractinoplanes lichenicola]|uniref:histidine kinase n=1 Tax=Paractinoplanes lichenicola TaxID=2802976 RepID=A0ABS1VYW5_9ACTN|nr:HAMP domain-containing sensor histidine kinase [Actinoplanes lichenicola]MBL7259681.1 HAMP domain-containing histidine kinase [Actinoplanes lichenicola]